ncbi:MAG TPA: GNAT family N-acetyltransferase [Thermomicrobiales bacterium]|nr:GNAT family N-acetyltransferase [Thermomicrobiales bacterium]
MVALRRTPAEAVEPRPRGHAPGVGVADSPPAAFAIRPLGRDDIPAWLALLGAHAAALRSPRPDAADRARLARAVASAAPPFRVLLARCDGRPVGFAAYYPAYSTFLARPLMHLEDLFVLAEARRHGVGQALLAAVRREAERCGCAALEWQVPAWNGAARAFYERQGGHPYDGWCTYRLTLEPGDGPDRVTTPPED